MKHPLDQAAAEPTPVVGSGCTRRYDPGALHEDIGTDFPQAAELWARLQARPLPESD